MPSLKATAWFVLQEMIGVSRVSVAMVAHVKRSRFAYATAMGAIVPEIAPHPNPPTTRIGGCSVKNMLANITVGGIILKG
jgi:hypothetical protein